MTRVKWREFRDGDHVPEGAVLLVSVGKSIDKFHADKGKDLAKAVTALEKSVAKYVAGVKKKYPTFAEKMRKRFEKDITAEQTTHEVVTVKAGLKKKAPEHSPEEKQAQQGRRVQIAVQVLRTKFPDLERAIAAAKTDIDNHDKRYDARERMRGISASLAAIAAEPDYKDLKAISERWTTNSLPQDWDGEAFEAKSLLARIKVIEGDIRFIKRRAF